MNEGPALPPSPPVPRVWDRELWVGLFVVLGVAAVIVLLFLLTTPATFRGRYFLVAIVPDAGGVRKGDAVEMRGVAIGTVKRFEILPEGAAMRLELDREYTVPSDSTVQLKPSGLLGNMVVEIIPGTSPEALTNGQSIKGKTEEDLSGRFENVASDAERVLERLEDLLSEQTVSNVQESTAEMREALKQVSELIAEQRQTLADVTESLRNSAQGIEQVTTGPEPKQVIKNLDAITRRLSKTAVSFDRSAMSAEEFLGRLERGEGALGMLSKDDSLYVNANQAAQNLSKAAEALMRLTEDIRRDPKRYINLKIF